MSKAFWKKYVLNFFLAIDQFANVLFAPVLNWALKTPPEARFGHPDETLSSVFGKNVRLGRCVTCKAICWVLDRLDPRPGSHCEQSIEEDEHSQL
jgi:hypothetical protein